MLKGSCRRGPPPVACSFSERNTFSHGLDPYRPKRHGGSDRNSAAHQATIAPWRCYPLGRAQEETDSAPPSDHICLVGSPCSASDDVSSLPLSVAWRHGRE